MQNHLHYTELDFCSFSTYLVGPSWRYLIKRFLDLGRSECLILCSFTTCWCLRLIQKFWPPKMTIKLYTYGFKVHFGWIKIVCNRSYPLYEVFKMYFSYQSSPIFPNFVDFFLSQNQLKQNYGNGILRWLFINQILKI